MIVTGKLEETVSHPSEGKRRERQRMRWLARLSGHKSEQIPGDSEGQGNRKESDTTK